MDYLTRESAPFSPEMWTYIDNAVLETARRHMVCRRFLNLFGPLGPGVTHVPVDNIHKDETLDEGFGLLTGRKLLELPILYEDFTLYWRDLETAFAAGRGDTYFTCVFDGDNTTVLIDQRQQVV